VDKAEWGMTPPTVNAYYNPSENNINFPAGILQVPFYGAGRDDAVNYGGIGAVIGHELTHGFDDQGSKFDSVGNLTNWWTEKDRAEFDKRTNCIASEYEKFSPLEGVHLNGKLTLGENTADNGGVRLAYMALQDVLKSKPGQVAEKLEGFTPEQRFFLGYAQVWCQNVTPETSRVLAITDPHSPGQFRVNGVVVNSEAFQQAFGCKADQPMVSATACRVW
jgi:predicted metalloendopeptidase